MENSNHLAAGPLIFACDYQKYVACENVSPDHGRLTEQLQSDLVSAGRKEKHIDEFVCKVCLVIHQRLKASGNYSRKPDIGNNKSVV